jgi:hypothetical protein
LERIQPLWDHHPADSVHGALTSIALSFGNYCSHGGGIYVFEVLVLRSRAAFTQSGFSNI